MKKGDIIEVSIDSIAFGGQGVAKYAIEDRDFTIFVDDAVPGDVVRARIGGRKRKYAYAKIEEFLEKSPKRVDPKCRHFGESGDNCGGCSLQRLSYEDQLKLKEQHVRDAIERLGGLDGSVVQPAVGCDDPWFYRNKMELSFDVDRDGVLHFGLHVRRRRYDLVKLEECFLFAPYLGKFTSDMRTFFEGTDYREESSEPTLKSLVIREGKNTGEILVNLIVENGEATFLDGFVEAVRKSLADENVQSIYCTHILNKKGQRKQLTETLLWGKATIVDKLLIDVGGKKHELAFEISPQAFFQPNTLQAQKLFGLAIEAAGLSGKEVLYDLYCGAGTIALACAPFAKKVYGIELNESALLNARANAERNGILNAAFEVGDVAKELPNLDEAADVVIVDPPRSGLHESVIEHIGAMQPRRVVYVSCNPTTLARDLALFTKTGYTLERVQPVDMFPQTYHIENVATLLLNEEQS
ncbi:23S rRNA (uracil(1939)-C(5))-methyltransferase RlmD [Candidatus Peregrinibacteria bacterium]|nr:23S rRNA (uracil(1939)-C(5))-methyltransferase RlmD [Candidatus Peregrinibacteria bacterium]